MNMQKARPFLITGLPRSRTAWLSAYLTFQGVGMCFHEFSKQVTDPVDVAKIVGRMKQSPLTYCGTADSALLLDVEGLRVASKTIPVVLVMRNLRDVKESLKKSFGWDLPSIVVDRYIEVAKIKEIVHVQYDDLDNESVMQSLQAFVCPRIRWSGVRFEEFKRFNIQVDVNKYKEALQCRG